MRKLLLIIAMLAFGMIASAQEVEIENDTLLEVSFKTSAYDFYQDSLYRTLAKDYVDLNNRIVSSYRLKKVGLGFAVMSGVFCVAGIINNEGKDAQHSSYASYIIGGVCAVGSLTCYTISLFKIKDRTLALKPNGLIYKF